MRSSDFLFESNSSVENIIYDVTSRLNIGYFFGDERDMIQEIVKRFIYGAINIRKKCTPFLKSINYNYYDHGIYRGLEEGYSNKFKIVYKKQVRMTDRTPTHTDSYIHDYTNKLFTEKFGHPYRNGLFVSGNIETALGYGYPGFVFPIGPFKYIWSNTIEDFYSSAPKYTWKVNREAGKRDLQNLINTYKNGQLLDGISSGNEIMIWCHSYYWVKSNYLMRFKTEYSPIQDAFQSIIEGTI